MAFDRSVRLPPTYRPFSDANDTDSCPSFNAAISRQKLDLATSAWHGGRRMERLDTISGHCAGARIPQWRPMRAVVHPKTNIHLNGGQRRSKMNLWRSERLHLWCIHLSEIFIWQGRYCLGNSAAMNVTVEWDSSGASDEFGGTLQRWRIWLAYAIYNIDPITCSFRGKIAWNASVPGWAPCCTGFSKFHVIPLWNGMTPSGKK